VDSVAVDNYFVEDLFVPRGDGKLFMRARLDSGMECNAISDEKAQELGFEIQPYSGPQIIEADGQTFKPIGMVEFLFHFQRILSAKTWKVPFLIFPSPPFDVAFGRTFIFKAKLLVRPVEGLPAEFEKLSRGE